MTFKTREKYFRRSLYDNNTSSKPWFKNGKLMLAKVEYLINTAVLFLNCTVTKQLTTGSPVKQLTWDKGKAWNLNLCEKFTIQLTSEGYIEEDSPLSIPDMSSQPALIFGSVKIHGIWKITANLIFQSPHAEAVYFVKPPWSVVSCPISFNFV